MIRARQLLKSSIIVIFLLGLGKITGLLRIQLVAGAFGSSPEYDAFTAANQLPEVFFTLIAGGALAAAFIPVYTDYLVNESGKKAARLANTVLTLVLLLLGGVSLVGAILAPWITSALLVPDFTPEMQRLTADLMRVILIQTVLFGLSGVLSSILNSHQHFATPALAPLALDIGYVAGLFLFVPEMGIMGLAWGTVIGGVLHILIQVPALFKYRIRIRPKLAWRMRGVREIALLMGPRVVTLGTIQLADLFIIRLASGLAGGSTSAYFYGYALMQFPETLFGTAIAIVVFPTMSELYNEGDVKGLQRTAVNALRIIWTLTIPSAALLVLLGFPAITAFLQRGAFDEASTRLVYSVLVVFSIRLVSEATLEIVARLFYARHNTRTPMFAYLGWLVVNVGLAYWFIGKLGIVGLALSSTVAFTWLAGLLYWLNRRELGGLGEKELGKTAVRAIVATLIMSLVVMGLDRIIASELLYLLAGGIAGVLVYVLVSFLLGGREIPDLVRLARQR
ncbi:MAG: murein biosynthesis integral membrane protein MurJ [Chloroflexi bacterium]|nr:murein biosynthesis integral membrane protein MurJ [Chloroflexota bacterium]